ncbi:hypothetical protein AK812_SmicGene31432 [Symbiodinium microadriaticum]|uniref:Uncharacterized protein n=1 Tax=Symbiodinium microadriaticum TaxID=2951 RepID=A0A1Q9CWQ5_SYMMI|nr:hypothetical protein AK812_SmicGene31432 [Symbiodinium microadriaticum]
MIYAPDEDIVEFNRRRQNKGEREGRDETKEEDERRRSREEDEEEEDEEEMWHEVEEEEEAEEAQGLRKTLTHEVLHHIFDTITNR